MPSSPIPPSIAALPSRAAELRSLLAAWCDTNSGSDNFAGLAAMLTVLETGFAGLPGLHQRVALEGTPAEALRVRVRPEAPLQVCLSGHFDTVYSADHPFQRCTQIDERTLRGPGVADMKGGLVVMLAALQAFEETPDASRLGYEVILNPDEEIGTLGAGPVLAAAAQRHILGLVFEPARPNGNLVRTRKGTGKAVVTCTGRAAHAARPEQGRNAIVALAEFLVGAHRIPAEVPGVMVNIGNVRGGGNATNVVPDFAQSELDVRVSHPGDVTALDQRLRELAAVINGRDGFHLETSLTFSRPPKATGPTEAVAFSAMQAAGRDLGLAPFDWVDVGGGSDGNLLFAAGLPNLDGLGPIGDNLHSDREFVDLPSLATRAQLAALFLYRLAAGEVVLPGRS